MSRYLITIEIRDTEVDDVVRENLERFTRRVQSAFDSAYPYALTGSVRVVHIVPASKFGPSSTETDS